MDLDKERIMPIFAMLSGGRTMAFLLLKQWSFGHIIEIPANSPLDCRGPFLPILHRREDM